MSVKQSPVGAALPALALLLAAVVLAACGSAEPNWATTETTLFPLQHSFMQELSEGGYIVSMFIEQEGATEVLVVTVPVDPEKTNQAANDPIFDHVVALAQKYRATEAAAGGLRVELFDPKPGGLVKDNVFESRDFDLQRTDTTIGTTITTVAPSSTSPTLGPPPTTDSPAESPVTGTGVAVGGKLSADPLAGLMALSDRAPFDLYCLGDSVEGAKLQQVLPEVADQREPKTVALAYRRIDDPDDLFVVDVVQYDPVASPTLKKPLPEWTLVQEVKLGEHTDRIYRGGSAGGFWYYVAQRGSTEINTAGYATSGRLNSEQLKTIARLLTPVGQSR